MSYIPYGRQNIDDHDIEAVVEVLRSDFITQGPCVPEFENVVASYCKAKHAVAVNSATSALHIACLALGVTHGDIVWTSAITFVASSNAALLCGAVVDFVDIDPKTINMCCDDLERKLKQAAAEGCLPKAVIPVHMCGQSCDMRRISELAKQFGFSIIEDASHAVGGSYRSAKVGSCRYSDIAVFSFHPVKIITTGEGGMALTNSNKLAAKMARLRSHGITRDEGLIIKNDPEAWYYEQVDLGLNYRMTDIAAALGISQMARLDEFVKSRRDSRVRYHHLLDSLPVVTPWENPDMVSSYHLYVINLEPQFLERRREIFDHMRSSGIGVNVHYIPVYLQPYYKNLGFEPGHCEKAEDYYLGCMTLPLFPGISLQEQERVVTTLAQAIG